MSDKLTVATAPKTATFQMRINPEIKKMLEEYYSQAGMTLTDAINVFFQQSLNAHGFPFVVTSKNREFLKEQAMETLIYEIQKGLDSVKSEADYISSDEVKKRFGVEK